MEKYTKTSANESFSDFLLETLARINFCQRKLILNNRESFLFPKICCFRENCFICKLLGATVKFFLNMQKNLGVNEKSENWNGRSLIVPLSHIQKKKANLHLNYENFCGY